MMQSCDFTPFNLFDHFCSGHALRASMSSLVFSLPATDTTEYIDHEDLIDDRSTDAAVKDFEGLIRTIPDNVPLREGCRVVENIISNGSQWLPNDMTQWVRISGALAPDYQTVYFPASSTASLEHRRFVTDGSVVGRDFIFHAELRGTPGHIVWMRTIEHTTWSATYIPVVLTDEWVRYSVPVRTVSIGAAGVYGGFINTGDSLEKTFNVRNAFFEDVTGQANQNPSTFTESISYSDYENGNTVVDNVVVPGQGAAISDAYWLHMPQRTNNMPYSRDLSNAGWNKRGICSATYDQVGIDGRPNAAALITNLGVRNIDDIYEWLGGLTAGEDVGIKLWLKTVTTTGDLRIGNAGSLANGEWSVDLSMLSTAEFEEITVNHPAVTEITPFSVTGSGAAGIWFYMNSGVASVIVGNVNSTVGVNSSDVAFENPIFTSGTAVTRTTCGMYRDSTGFPQGAGTLKAVFAPMWNKSDAPVVNDNGIGMTVGPSLLYFGSTSTITLTDGTSYAGLPGLTYDAGDVVEAYPTWGEGVFNNTGRNITAAGAWQTRPELAYDTSFSDSGAFRYFRGCSGIVRLYDAKLYDTKYSQAQIEAGL
ncbi:MAG: hypothetical protein AB2747_05380 [Candidatus Thiodiazotropha taylori]